MKTRVHKWGNSLALRIPKTFALEAGLEEDSPVEISLLEGRLLFCHPQPIMDESGWPFSVSSQAISRDTRLKFVSPEVFL